MVRDTDGSAFITKAEFDSLKNNFQSQIDNYNSSIDSKIDGAIASYLAGVKVSSSEQIYGIFAGFAQLKFYNKFGIKSYTRNSRIGDEKLYTSTNVKPTEDMTSINNPAGAQLSYVFDFWGEDPVGSVVTRKTNEVNSIHGFDYFYNNASDQAGIYALFVNHAASMWYEPNAVVGWMLKFGHYGYLGARRGYATSADGTDTSCTSGQAIGDKGYCPIAGFAPAVDSPDAVQFIRPGFNWVWWNTQPDYSAAGVAVADITKPYGVGNNFSYRKNDMSGFKPSGRAQFISSVPDGYSAALKVPYKDSTGTTNNMGYLWPDSSLTSDDYHLAWYNLDPTKDYRHDTTSDPFTMRMNWNIKRDTKVIRSLMQKIDVSDVMLAFDTEQNLYICKYGLKNDVWPINPGDVTTGDIEAYDDTLTLFPNTGSGNGHTMLVWGTTAGINDWKSEGCLPAADSFPGTNNITLKLPSFQKFDHLYNYINYKSALLNDPLKIGGGVRVGLINTDGTAEYKIKINRSSGNVNNCKVYLKKSPFSNTVPTPDECVSGSWDGLSGAICGISPHSDGTLTLRFPVIKNDELWIMVSPESRPAGSIAPDDTSYAYAQLVQCEGNIIKEN